MIDRLKAGHGTVVVLGTMEQVVCGQGVERRRVRLLGIDVLTEFEHLSPLTIVCIQHGDRGR